VLSVSHPRDLEAAIDQPLHDDFSHARRIGSLDGRGIAVEQAYQGLLCGQLGHRPSPLTRVTTLAHSVPFRFGLRDEAFENITQQFEHDPAVFNIGRQMRCHELRVVFVPALNAHDYRPRNQYRLG